MIWFVFGSLLLLILIYILPPILTSAAPKESDGQETLAELKQQLLKLQADVDQGVIDADTASESRQALERRLLTLVDADDTTPQSTRSEAIVQLARTAIPLALAFGGAGIYLGVGSPDFEDRATFTTAQDTSGHNSADSLENMVASLEQRLANDPAPTPESVILLARSLMALGRYDDAFVAYDWTLELTNNHPQVLAEMERSREFIAQAGDNMVPASPAATAERVPAGMPSMPALDQQTVDNANQMSAGDRAAMIDSMVSGLAMRLAEQPDDPEGWARLIRARMGLGQTGQASQDFETARQTFADAPEKRRYIESFAAELGL